MSNPVIERVSVRLTLADLTGSSDAGWISELKKTSNMWVEQNKPRLANIQVALEEEPTSYAVVVYQDPVEQLVGALLRGEEPEEALVEWQSFTSSLLELHERFPDRMSLCPRSLSRVGLENLVDHVARSTGLPLGISTDTEPSVPTPVQDEDIEIYGVKLAAMQLLDLRNPKVLGERLEAASVETADKPYRPDLISKFLTSRNKLLQDRTEYLKLRSNNRDQKKELDSIKKENALLIPQLHRTQEGLESLLLEKQSLTAKVEEMRKGRDYRKTRIQELERGLQEQAEKLESVLLEKRSLTAKVREMRKGRDYRKTKIQELERELLEQAGKLEWLRAVRDQHRSSARELRVEQKQSKSDIRTLEKQVETLGAELKSIKCSRSWRYTRVLRQIKGTAGRV